MATGLFCLSTSPLSSFPAPLAILTQLTLSSASVTNPAYSVARVAAFPLISAYVYSVLSGARTQMRPRWASLFGGTSFMLLLQYLDSGLVRQWNYHGRGPASQEYSKRATEAEAKNKASGFWAQFRWAWSNMFALRHVNTKYEARNTPPFRDSDPSYIPSKPAFLMKETGIAILCYLLLDLLAQRPPPPNAPELFDEALIPVFRRLGEVTIPQLRLRALSIVGFAATFWALIRGYAAVAGTLTVALGVSEPRDWRPPFGSLSQAYSIQNLWGKVWHQNLRSLLTSPARIVTYDVLQLPHGTLIARFCSMIVAFTLSGVMHSCAGIAAGMPSQQLNVLHFFLTQAFGVIVKDLVLLLFLKVKDQKGMRQEKEGPPPLTYRIIGYLWVAAFMTWSGPVWLYPQAAKPVLPGTKTSFWPYSVMKAWKTGDIRA